MIVVVDVGTSSIRVSLIDKHARTLYYSQNRYSVSYFDSGAAQTDMAVFDTALWNTLKDTALYVKEKIPKNAASINAFSVTAQRSSVIPVDKNGKALYQALMWQDTKSSYVCDMLKPQDERIYALSGMHLSPVFSAPKIRWLKDNKSEIYNSAYKIIGFCEYTLFQLAGVFAVDSSVASRSTLFDVTERKWSDELIELFGIEKEKLCSVVPPGSCIGCALPRLCELYGLSEAPPVITAGGDQQCAAVGSGCIENGDIMINIGTGAFVLALVDKPVFCAKKGTSCNVSALKDKWVIEGAVLSAGKTLDWVNDCFFACANENRAYENFTAACLKAPAGSNGIRFSVHLSGKGCPDWKTSAKGAIAGLTLQNTKNDIARAVLEGIAVAIAECFFCVQAATQNQSRFVRVSGGLAKDPLFIRILAAACKKELIYTQQTEATVFGAWIIAVVALGLYTTAKDAFDVLSKNIHSTVYKSTEQECRLYENIASELKKLST